jgi:hypothetical protein
MPTLINIAIALTLLLIVVLLVVNTSRNYGSLGNRLFWVSVIVSGIVGMKGGGELAFWISPGHFWILAFSPVVAILTFLVLYRFVALNIVLAVQNKKGVELDRPSVTRGVIYSAIIPPVLIVLMLVGLYFGH